MPVNRRTASGDDLTRQDVEPDELRDLEWHPTPTSRGSMSNHYFLHIGGSDREVGGTFTILGRVGAVSPILWLRRELSSLGACLVHGFIGVTQPRK
jgi:hypothetical protein